MADLVNGYALSEEAVRDLNELFRKVRAKARVHTGRPDEFGRPGPRPGFHEPVKLTSLTTTGGLYPGVRSVLDLSTMVYADETVAIWVRSLNGRALNDTTARLWARLEGMTDPGADPRALYLVDDPGGTPGSVTGTLDFGTSGSAAASPPGVLDLPTLTVAGPPTWVPPAGVYPLVWDSATGILYAWTGAAWVDFLTSPLTTKGDVWVYGSADTRLGVGSDGQVLTADSAQATGLKWAAASGGAGTELVALVGTPVTTVSNTVTKTSILGAAILGSKTTAASYWTTGRVVRVFAGGSVTEAGASLTFSFEDTANAKTFASLAAVGAGTFAGGWRVELVLTYSGGTVYAEGTILLDGFGTNSLRLSGSVAPSTNAQTLDLMVTWSATGVGNTITQNVGTVEGLN